jgi:hypothetical protein
MTRTTYKLSNEGVIKVDKARQLKGWNKTSKVWAETGMSSESTLKRLLRGEAISADHFIRLCQAVGIEDWQGLVDWHNDKDSTRVPESHPLSNSETPETATPRYSLTVTGIFTEDQKLQIEGLLEVLGKLISKSEIFIKRQEAKEATE